MKLKLIAICWWLCKNVYWKLSLWQIWCLQQENYVLNHILWIKRLGVVFMNSKTHMVVMKLVSQHLDEYKNNGLISKLHEFLSGQIWVCCLAWFLINHGLILWLRSFYGLYWTYRGVVMEIFVTIFVTYAAEMSSEQHMLHLTLLI